MSAPTEDEDETARVQRIVADVLERRVPPRGTMLERVLPSWQAGLAIIGMLVVSAVWLLAQGDTRWVRSDRYALERQRDSIVAAAMADRLDRIDEGQGRGEAKLDSLLAGKHRREP